MIRRINYEKRKCYSACLPESRLLPLWCVRRLSRFRLRKKFRYDVLNSPSFKFCGPLELENAYCCSNCGTAFGTAVFLDSVPKTRKLDKSTNRIYIDGLEPLHIAKKEEELLRSILGIDRPNKIESLEYILREGTMLLSCKDWRGTWRYILITDTGCVYVLSKTELVAVALALVKIEPDQLRYTVMTDEGCVKTAIILNDGKTTASIEEHFIWKRLARMTGGDEPISHSIDIEYKRVIAALCDIQKLGIEGYIKKRTATEALPL